MGVKMIVTKAFRPGGSGSKELQPGSSFVASTEAQATLFRALGFCADAPPEKPVEPKRTYVRKAVAPEPVIEPVPEPVVEPVVVPEPVAPVDEAPSFFKQPRTYLRRDLRAKTED